MGTSGEVQQTVSDLAANAIVGMCIFESGTYFDADKSGPEIDIRVHAAEVVLSGLGELRGLHEDPEILALALDTDEIKPASQREIDSIREEIGEPNLMTLRRKLTMAHNLRAAFPDRISGEESEHAGTKARAQKQRGLLAKMSHHWQTVSRPSGRVPLTDEAIVMGSSIIGIAPTAAGKTYVIGTLLRRAGIGRAFAPGDDKPLAADVILPSIQLARQFAGEEGDDTFRMAFGSDVPLSQHHSRSIEELAGAPVRLFTRETYRRSLEQGVVSPHEVAAIVWDEAHTMLGPRTLGAALAIKKSRVNLAGITATAGYSLRKDVRRHFDHTDAGSLLEFIATGIVRPVELSAYKAPSEEFGLEKMASQLAAHDIQKGRGVLVVCGRGGETAQARRVTQLINRLIGIDGARQVTSYVDGYEKNIAAYESGRVSSMVVAGMLEQGYSSRRGIDSVITVGPTMSLLRKTHIAGRVLRHSKNEDDIGYLREVYDAKTLQSYGSAMPATFFQVFGIDAVRQHVRLAPQTIEAKETDEGTEYNLRHGENMDGRNSPRDYSSSAQEAQEGEMYIPDVEALLLPEHPVRRIFLASENVRRSREVSPGSKELSELAAIYDTLPAFIRKRLVEQGFAYEEVWVRLGSQQEVEIWFGEDAQQYLRDNPPPPIAEESMMNVKQIAQLTDLSRPYVKHLIEKLGLDSEERLSATTGMKGGYYGGSDVALILQEIDQIPEALETDVPVDVLIQETDRRFVLNFACSPVMPIHMEYKRRSAVFGKRGIVQHVSAEDAERIREVWNGEGFMSLTQIAEATQATLGTVQRNLTEEESNNLVRRRMGRTTHQCLEEEIARPVIERLRPRPLPVHLVPVRAIEQMSTMGYSTLMSWLKRQDNLSPETIRLGGQGADPQCYPWEVLRRLADAKRLNVGVRVNMLVNGPADSDPVKKAYSLMLQATYLPPEKLSEQYVDYPSFLQALRCSHVALWAIVSKMDIGTEAFKYDDQSGAVQAVEVGASAKIRQRVLAHSREPQLGWVAHERVIQAAEERGYQVQEAEEILYERLQHIVRSGRAVFRGSRGVDVWYEDKNLLDYVVGELAKRYT